MAEGRKYNIDDITEGGVSSSPKTNVENLSVNAELLLGTKSRSPFKSGIGQRKIEKLVLWTKEQKICFGIRS